MWLFVPIASASDFGLANPAEKDFAEIRIDTANTENFARQTPAFNDRVLPTPQKPQPIRQVSDFDNDPFPMVSPNAAAQPFLFDGGVAPPGTQNNVMPYDPNIGGYSYPQYTVQDMQNLYLAQQQFAQQLSAQQQFAQQQFAQYPQYQQEGYMMPADVYAQYGYSDPYGGAWAYQPDQQAVPDQSAMYQAFLLQQEMARRQAEEVRTNNEKEVNETKPQTSPQWTLDNLVPIRVSSPLGETMFVCAKTISPFSTPPGPDKGVGMPLVNKSWLDHPYYFGGFVGYMSGSKELVSQMIEQKSGGTGGFTFGYNFNDYWGLESRLHLASIDIRDTEYAQQLFESNFQDQFPGMATPVLTTRTNELTILDAAVHYYPLGNAKWRPYFKYGLGVGRQRFVNTFGYENKADIVTMPLGVGIRYWWNERIAIQADLHNDVVFASGIAKTQNNVSFTVGLTYAFGSGRTKPPIQYWPATPSMGSKW